MFDIINTINEKDRQDEFIALGCYRNLVGYPGHSVFIIKFNGLLYQFHYTGAEVLFNQNIPPYCFHKITFTISPILIPAFIVMCREIGRNASPTYGYFYSGEFFDSNGQHFSDKTIGQTMTCAGFCLNVLKGFLEENYIEYSEWTEDSHEEADYLKNYAQEYGLNIEDIAESHRRISPLDLMCSAFFTDLPIRKADIDSKKSAVSDFIEFY